MIFRTHRLTLRPLILEDAQLIFAIMSDPEAMRFWDRPALTRPAVAEEIVGEQVAAMGGGKYLYWTACLDGAAIGSCDLSRIDGSEGETGFLFRRDHWGQGYAREALAPVIAHGFAALGLKRLWARIHAGNDRARRLLQELEFVPASLPPGRTRGGNFRPGCEWHRRDSSEGDA